MNNQDSGVRPSDNNLHNSSLAESERVKQAIFRKYSFYKWADDQISFAFIAAVCLLVITRYTELLALSIPIAMSIVVVLSIVGIFVSIKKREWLYKKKRVEKKT